MSAPCDPVTSRVVLLCIALKARKLGMSQYAYFDTYCHGRSANVLQFGPDVLGNARIYALDPSYVTILDDSEFPVGASASGPDGRKWRIDHGFPADYPLLVLHKVKGEWRNV